MGQLPQQKVDDLLGPADRPHRAIGQSSGQPIYLLIELVDLHDVVDQPDKLGLRGGHQVAGEQILFGARKADELWPDQRAPVTTRPALTCGSPILAWSATMIMSTVAPSPTAWPLTRAMIGLSSAASGADDRVPGAGVFQMPERVGLPVSSSRLRKSSLRPGDRGVKVKVRARRVHCSSAELSHGISIGGASTEISVLRQGEGKRWLEAR
jgi:hypothetical protein